MKNPLSFFSGFLLLFFIYHFPEFFSAFWITAVFKIGFLLIAYFLCRMQGWPGLGGFGLPFTKKWLPTLMAGLVTGLGAFALSVVASVGFHLEEIQSIQGIPVFLHSLPLILVMTFFPSIAEDILTRGYFLGHLASLKPVAWMLVTSVVYVLNHIWRLGEGLPVLSYLFLLGMVLSYCVLLKKSLWLALGIHWGANIAFELSRAGIQFRTLQNHDLPTWILAAVWALVLTVLVIKYRRFTRFPLEEKRNGPTHFL